MTEDWIENLKKGALRQHLSIPEDKNIPSTLVNKIVDAKIGDTIVNPTKIGKEQYKVTDTLHKEAVSAKTLSKWRK